jgi:preprotein translocase subunit SecF
MQIFKNTNFDFLGKKWPFIIASLVLTVLGLGSMAMKGGPRYGIDFRGGALMYVLFNQTPPVDKIRSVLSAKIPGEVTVVNVTSSNNEVIIGTEISDEKTLNANRQTMVDVLENTFGSGQSGKLDVNNSGAAALADRLRDPLQRAGVAMNEQQLQDTTKAIITFKDTQRSGLLRSFEELSGVPGVTPQVISTLKQECSLSPFTIRQTEVVGPKVGADLRNKAILATLYALAGMLVYIAFRFEWIYGVAAVVAVFHDTIITIGLFSVFNKEISLTVIAALLTLVGYSMNDTIVVFDRIRENLKLMRREKFENLINISINQTLSRTILTSGLTFLTAVALWLFGGPVLNGFAFALVIGIIIGTYSSIFIASPILVFWQNWLESRKRVAPVAVPALKETAAKKAVRTR